MQSWSEDSMYKSRIVTLFLGLVALLCVACGVPEAPATKVKAPSTSAQKTAGTTLKEYAANHAGKPGAIYVGDLKQLAGTSPGTGLGDGNGNVPLEMLEKNSYFFETDYYAALLEKAKLTNPTPLTYDGDPVEIQYACLNRALLPCDLGIQYFLPNIEERTNGKLKVTISSYPELGLSGANMLQLIDDGTIGFAHVQPAYVGGTMPLIDIIYIWGLWKDPKSEHEANTSLMAALDSGVSENSGGSQLIYHVWYGGNDQYFFSTRGSSLEDFDGLKARSHGTTMTDYINGLGGEGQFVAFAEVYTALERGILDAGVTGAHAGHGQRWYEVTDNLIGPAISTPMGFEMMNRTAWDKLPKNLQDILVEEGTKMELENLRLAAVWNETGVKVNVDKGMTFLEWTPEQKQHIYENVALGRVLPNWIKRVGPDEIAIWNDSVSPWSKVKIESDGSITMID